MHSRASSEIRPGCLGLRSVKSWKTPGMETTQPLWEACPTPGLSSSWESFPLYPAWTSLVSICIHRRSLPFRAFPYIAVNSLTLPSQQPPWRHEDAALRCPWSQPCSRLKQPWSSSLSSQGKCSRLPSILGALSWRAINTMFLSLLWQQFADFGCCHHLNNFPSNVWKEETVKIPYETFHFYTNWLLFQLLVGIHVKSYFYSTWVRLSIITGNWTMRNNSSSKYMDDILFKICL